MQQLRKVLWQRLHLHAGSTAGSWGLTKASSDVEECDAIRLKPLLRLSRKST